MTYLSECLADSPTLIFPMDTYSSGFADSSGNGRHLNLLAGTAPTTTATGPDGAANDAASWGTSPGYVYTTYTQTSPAVGTYEVWFRYASAPAVNVRLANWCPNTGNLGSSNYITLRSDGKVSFGVYDGSTSTEVVSSAALSTNTWHHVVGSWGSGGQVLRIDKATVGTGDKTTASTASSASAFRVHGQYNGIGDSNQTGAVDMAWAAFYPTKLTTTRTDAHYDAMTVATGANVTATAATATAAGVAPVVSADASAAPPAATASAAAIAPSVTVPGDAAVTAPAASATASALPPTVAADSTLAVTAATASAAALVPTVALGATIAAPFADASASAPAPFVDNGSGSQTITPPAATATADAPAPLVLQIIETSTDTSNSRHGRRRYAYATATVTRPVAAPPDTLTLATKVDKAVAYPAPTMVNGRPT